MVIWDLTAPAVRSPRGWGTERVGAAGGRCLRGYVGAGRRTRTEHRSLRLPWEGKAKLGSLEVWLGIARSSSERGEEGKVEPGGRGERDSGVMGW